MHSCSHRPQHYSAFPSATSTLNPFDLQIACPVCLVAASVTKLCVVPESIEMLIVAFLTCPAVTCFSLHETNECIKRDLYGIGLIASAFGGLLFFCWIFLLFKEINLVFFAAMPRCETLIAIKTKALLAMGMHLCSQYSLWSGSNGLLHLFGCRWSIIPWSHLRGTSCKTGPDGRSNGCRARPFSQFIKLFFLTSSKPRGFLQCGWLKHKDFLAYLVLKPLNKVPINTRSDNPCTLFTNCSKWVWQFCTDPEPWQSFVNVPSIFS